MEDKSTIIYKMNREVAKKICNYYEVDIDTRSEEEVCILIDDFIYNALMLMELC